MDSEEPTRGRSPYVELESNLKRPGRSLTPTKMNQEQHDNDLEERVAQTRERLRKASHSPVLDLHQMRYKKSEEDPWSIIEPQVRVIMESELEKSSGTTNEEGNAGESNKRLRTQNPDAKVNFEI